MPDSQESSKPFSGKIFVLKFCPVIKMQVVDDKMNKTIKYVLIRIFNFNFFTNHYDGFANPKNVSEKN